MRRHRPGEVPGGHDLERLLTREPTPEEAAATADESRRLLDLLEEPGLRQIALWKVEGYTNEEIAARLDCVPRYLELLAAGGSGAPHRLLARLGVDVNDPGFWELGLPLLGDMMSEAEELAAQVEPC
jgi:hypothetical protein